MYTVLIKALLVLPILSLFSREGIRYSNLIISNNKHFNFLIGSQSIHVLEIDPDFYEIKPVKALDNGIGRESVLTFDGRACGALLLMEMKMKTQAKILSAVSLMPL
ncbi:MAG: hypothetical protein ACOYK9_01865 [Chlamydiia bacterium]